jgi:hypothetical protein
MNDRISMADRIKGKAVDVISNVLVRQAEIGTRESHLLFISEVDFPVELMREDAKEN